MNLVLNITECLSKKEPLYSKIVAEASFVLSRKIQLGQLDSTKEQTLIVCTKFGAAQVTIIPKRYFQ